MIVFDLLAFDADDTLWHNERLYANAQARFVELMSRYHDADWVSQRLYTLEMRNLEHFGYGVKGFALSMIETAVELTEGRISGKDVQVLVDTAKEMLDAEIELLPQVADVIPRLAKTYPLMLVTKGDLRDQESKIDRSGLGEYFKFIEVVSYKDVGSYKRLLGRYSIDPSRFLMVGNSLRSDILPVLELGGYAVYIPQEVAWQHESAGEPPDNHERFFIFQHIGQLPALLQGLEEW